MFLVCYVHSFVCPCIVPVSISVQVLAFEYVSILLLSHIIWVFVVLFIIYCLLLYTLPNYFSIIYFVCCNMEINVKLIDWLIVDVFISGFCVCFVGLISAQFQPPWSDHLFPRDGVVMATSALPVVGRTLLLPLHEDTWSRLHQSLMLAQSQDGNS